MTPRELENLEILIDLKIALMLAKCFSYVTIPQADIEKAQSDISKVRSFLCVGHTYPRPEQL